MPLQNGNSEIAFAQESEIHRPVDPESRSHTIDETTVASFNAESEELSDETPEVPDE